MVLDFMTVAAFVLLCAYKLGLKLLSMPVCVVPSHFQKKWLTIKSTRTENCSANIRILRWYTQARVAAGYREPL